MILALLHRLGWLPRLLFVLLALGAGHPAQATHLLGGEMTYRYLNANGPTAAPLRYEITVTIYNNCNNAAIRAAADVVFYDQASGNKMYLSTVNFPTIGLNGEMEIPETSISGCQMPFVPAGCTITGASQPFQLQKFVGVVNLPATTQGYYALWSDRARNTDIFNLVNPGSQSMTLYSTLSPPLIPNSSPIFSDVAVAVICTNDTTYLLNNAVDPDGDRLTYTFGQPYGVAAIPIAFAPPPTQLIYKAGYGFAAATPLGTAAGSYAAINASTGIAKYIGGSVGYKYAVAVDVSEYRTIGGQQVLIGTTRRDLQLVVANCPTTMPPVLPTTTAATPIPRSYTMEAGSTLSIPLASTQADGHPLAMTLTSVLLDGTGGHNAAFNGDQGTLTPGNPAGSVIVTGPTGAISGTLVYTAGCNEARATPYDVALTIKDNGCAGKLVTDVLRITVTKPAGPNAVSGDLVVCGLNTTRSYTASGGTAPIISWRAVGGTIVGSSTANPVQITWPTAGTFTLVARGITQYGCLTDSVTKTVTVSPAATLTVTGNRTICQGSSTTLAMAGTSTYTVTGGPTTITSVSPFVLSPSTTTTYTITEVTNSSPCGATAQVVVTVLPQPAANVGVATRDVCSGAATGLGAAAVAGNTYSWSPATGLGNSGIANPTLILSNSTNTLQTYTYTLTVTNTATGCTNTGTVAVTVNPAVVPNAISASQTVCVGTAPAPLTDAAAGTSASTYVYQWESSPDNLAWTPVASATNPTYAPGVPTATTYYRRHLTVGMCSATYSNVIEIKVQPLAAVALPALPAQCAGTAFTFVPVPANAGPAPTYQWSINGVVVATSATYTSTTLANGDQVQVVLTPSPGFCTGGTTTATTTVRLVPEPAPTLAISLLTALPACAGDGSMFGIDQTANAGTNPQYQWRIDGVDVPGATGTTFTSTTLRNNQSVTLLLRTTTACARPISATSNAVVVPISLPAVVSAGPDKTIMEGESVLLNGQITGNYPAVWTPAQTLTFVNGDLLHPQAAPLITTIYTLSAGAGYCAAQSSMTVTVTPRVRIPNAFTPNGDGNDDTWQLDNAEAYPNNYVLVFNRWGNKIFETAGYRRGNEWNGTINGQAAPLGTYYYLIRLGNGKSYTGPLTIVY